MDNKQQIDELNEVLENLRKICQNAIIKNNQLNDKKPTILSFIKN